MTTCACGCGGTPKPGKRYLHGHWGRKTGPDYPEYLEEDRGFETPCWIWQRAMTRTGNGLVTRQGTTTTAHRMIYERERGPVPDGMNLFHRCGISACVNPDHLDVKTKSDGISGVMRRYYAVPRPRRLAETCGKGHPFTPENTKITKKGRQCRTCQQAAQRASYERKAAAQRAEPVMPPPLTPDALDALPRCPRGHVIAGENASPRGDGRFRCRICANAVSERYQRRKAERQEQPGRKSGDVHDDQ